MTSIPVLFIQEFPQGAVAPREITNCLTILKRGVVGSNGVGGPFKKGDPFKQRLVSNKFFYFTITHRGMAHYTLYELSAALLLKCKEPDLLVE